jgi:uncharacterized protein (DUF2236 family)
MSCPFSGADDATTIPDAAGPTPKKSFRRGSKDDTLVREDEGFFGPDSVTWKVWRFPGFALQAFARAVTLEHLDPDLVAAVDASGQVYKRTPVRYDRTMEYFAAVLTADAQTMTRMSDILMKVHDRSYGVNPVTGNNFEANNPDSQMWIHVTAWLDALHLREVRPGKALPRRGERVLGADGDLRGVPADPPGGSAEDPWSGAEVLR